MNPIDAFGQASQELEGMADLVTGFVAILIIALITAPLWLRLLNEVGARTLGVTVAVCPHCGMAGLVVSDGPRVFK